MPDYPLGQSIVLTFHIYSDQAKTVPADPATLTLDVLNPDDTTTTVTLAGGGIVKTSTGVYTYTTTPTQTAGYRWQLTATSPDTAQFGSFTVLAKYGMGANLDVLTLPEARTAVGLATTDTNSDERLVTYVTAISRRLDLLCGPIVQRTVTGEAHDGGSWWIDLQWSPITSVTTVTEYAATAATVLTRETVGTTPSNAYLIKPWREFYKGRIYRRSGGIASRFALGDQNVLVTYVAGRYTDTASVDAKFKQAAAFVLSNIFRKEQRPVNPAFQGPGLLGDTEAPGIPSYLIPYVADALLVDEIIPSVA